MGEVDEGDVVARERLLHLLRADPRRLRRRSISLGVPVDDADDAAQLAALRAWRSVGDVRSLDEGALCAWLDAIARRVAIDLHRSRRDDRAEFPDEVVASQDVEAEAETCQRLSAILRRIRDLPDDLREPLILQMVEERTAPEIAARLGLTSAAVRQRIARARKLLRGDAISSHSGPSSRLSS